MSSKLLAPQIDTSPENYWGLPSAPVEVDWLPPTDMSFAREVMSDPRRFGFAGTPEEESRIRLGALYVVEAQESRAGQDVYTALAENNVAAFHQAVDRSFSFPLQPGDIGPETQASLCNTAAIITRRAANISGEQVRWEKDHGTLDTLSGGIVTDDSIEFQLSDPHFGNAVEGNLEGAAPEELETPSIPDTPELARRLTRRMMRGGILRRPSKRFNRTSPADLAERLELPTCIAGPVISSMVSFGVLERDTAGDTLTATPMMGLEPFRRRFMRSLESVRSKVV